MLADALPVSSSARVPGVLPPELIELIVHFLADSDSDSAVCRSLDQEHFTPRQLLLLVPLRGLSRVWNAIVTPKAYCVIAFGARTGGPLPTRFAAALRAFPPLAARATTLRLRCAPESESRADGRAAVSAHLNLLDVCPNLAHVTLVGYGGARAAQYRSLLARKPLVSLAIHHLSERQDTGSDSDDDRPSGPYNIADLYSPAELVRALPAWPTLTSLTVEGSSTGILRHPSTRIPPTASRPLPTLTSLSLTLTNDYIFHPPNDLPFLLSTWTPSLQHLSLDAVFPRGALPASVRLALCSLLQLMHLSIHPTLLPPAHISKLPRSLRTLEYVGDALKTLEIETLARELLTVYSDSDASSDPSTGTTLARSRELILPALQTFTVPLLGRPNRSIRWGPPPPSQEEQERDLEVLRVACRTRDLVLQVEGRPAR